jgi:DNA-binding transcriptional ArsR family regulator
MNMDKLKQGQIDQTNSIKDINSKLEVIHREVTRIRERSNQEHLDLILLNTRKDLANSMAVYVTEDIETDLERGMVSECHLKETCKQTFTDFLDRNVDIIKQVQDMDKKTMDENYSKLDEMKNEAPYEKCRFCIHEVSSLFMKQLKLIESLKLYESPEFEETDLNPFSEELIVKDVLEPLSNKQRLQILQSMATETKTYSELSEVTGLRGGNLLFHIQKLQDGGLIFQRHERGDYMVTKKGFAMLNALKNMNKFLENEL